MNTIRIKIALVFLTLGIGWSACLPATPVSGLPAPFSTAATIYYVRTDGGSPDQCTGQTDAAYPGSGTGQDCAWDHPFRALSPGGTPRIAGGDTLVIASGSYTMGLGASGADNCESDYSWDCHVPPIPSGPDPANPTRILGAGWDSGCANPPELWGTERANMIINLTDASNVEIACLEITDHSGCVKDHTGGLACKRDTYPYGDWATDGLYAEDASNVHLRNLNIHGLASAGIRAGRLTDWTVEDVRIAGNGWVGWEGDIEGDDSNSGTLIFRRWTVEWNGCGETYPGGQPTGCWAQTAGGYGDGVGTGTTGGDWIIEDSAFLHNTSDGLDLLYHSLGGRITLDRVRAEGNAGNQVKVTGQTAITNSVLVGNCAFFERQSFTYNVDNCRALGNTLEVVYTGGEQVSIVNSTFYGQGDGLICGGPREGYSCDGTETLTGRNNVFLGDTDYFDPGDDTFLFYQEGCAGLKFDADYNIISNTKNIECGVNSDYVDSGEHDICADPQLTGMRPILDSPAIDAGTTKGAPADDFDGTPRDAHPDMGAFEYPPLSAVRSFHSIDPGGIATYTLKVRPIGVSTAAISLVTASPSPSLTLQLVPTQVVPPGQAILTASDAHTGTALLPGLHYDIPITGTNGATQTIHVSLLVGGVRVYLPLILRDWATSQPQPPPQVAGCAVFPADNVWNVPVDTLPVDANSAAYVATIGAGDYVHADFGSGTWEGEPIGIPYVDVPGSQPLVNVTFDYADESDPGPYPIPPDAPIEGGSESDGDRHVLVVDRDNCILYELFYAWPQLDGSWKAGSGAILDLNSHDLRPDTWTSADAAGLPILPGLVRYDEVTAGEIQHAVRFTAPETRNAHIWPARHDASELTGEQYPPMGQRFRLRAGFDVSGFSPEVQVILQALKKYGMILADNGAPWFISGVPDERWDNDHLHELRQVHGSDFEAVDESSLMVDPDSGQAQSP